MGAVLFSVQRKEDDTTLGLWDARYGNFSRAFMLPHSSKQATPTWSEARQGEGPAGQNQAQVGGCPIQPSGALPTCLLGDARSC